MSKEERYAEHTVAWELPNGDSVTKSNYNLADIETKYMPIQTEVISDNKDKTITEQQQRIAELEDKWNKIKMSIFDRCEYYNDLVEDGYATEYSKGKQYLLNEIYDEMQELDKGEWYE